MKGGGGQGERAMGRMGDNQFTVGDLIQSPSLLPGGTDDPSQWSSGKYHFPTTIYKIARGYCPGYLQALSHARPHNRIIVFSDILLKRDWEH